MSKDPLKISGMHNGAHGKGFANDAKLREKMIEPKKKLWEYLRLKPRGFKYRRQHLIGIYILDFYCHKLRLSIEIDGGYHLPKAQKEKDAGRTEYLKESGISENRYTNDQVMKRFEVIIENIEQILRAASLQGRGKSEDNKYSK